MHLRLGPYSCKCKLVENKRVSSKIVKLNGITMTVNSVYQKQTNKQTKKKEGGGKKKTKSPSDKRTY